MTILTVKDEKPDRLKDRLISLIRPYEIKTVIRCAAGIRIRETIYIRKHGKIRWHAVAESIGESRAVLCDKDLAIVGSGLRKIKSSVLGAAWCKNFVCDVLDKLAEKGISPRLSFFDPYAEHSSFAEKLCDYTDELTVVTEMPRFYENEAGRIEEKIGTVIRVFNDTERLLPCDMLIIPDRLEHEIHPPALVPVFTSCRPGVSLAGTVIDSYRVSLPEKYRPLCPEGVDEEELMAVLYEYEGADMLGDIIPEYGMCAGKALSARQVSELVINRMSPPLSLCD